MLRLVLIDDHGVVAEALQATLAGEEGIEVVGVAPTGALGIEVARAQRPDVAVIDFRLPDMTGANVVRAIRRDLPECRNVILTGSGQERALLDAIDAGAVAFVTKDQRFAEVVTAIRAAHAGEVTFPPALLAKVLPDLRQGSRTTTRLSARERDVLEMIAAGMGNAEIATRLYISVNTVRNHVAALLTKLDARTRGEAVAIAVREGIIVPGTRPGDP